jgi:hypothetical protein
MGWGSPLFRSPSPLYRSKNPCRLRRSPRHTGRGAIHFLRTIGAIEYADSGHGILFTNTEYTRSLRDFSCWLMFRDVGQHQSFPYKVDIRLVDAQIYLDDSLVLAHHFEYPVVHVCRGKNHLALFKHL